MCTSGDCTSGGPPVNTYPLAVTIYCLKQPLKFEIIQNSLMNQKCLPNGVKDQFNEN